MIRFACPLLVVAVIVSSGSPGLAASTAQDPVVEELTWLLRGQSAKLLKERNENGAPYRRATFSRNFRKLEDGTYQTTFTEDTAGENRMRTERFLLTLGRPNGKEWEVVGRELQDTYEGLVRSEIGDERFYRFDTVRVSKNGLALDGSIGTAYVDYFDGEIYRIVLGSPDLSFSFDTPVGVPPHVRQRHDFIRADDPEALDFELEHVSISCSPGECRTFLAESFGGLEETARENLDSHLLDLYTKRDNRIREARKENGFSGFRTQWEDDHEYHRIYLNGKSDEHNAWLEYDNQGTWEIRFGCSGYGTFLGYYLEQTRQAVSPRELESRHAGHARDFEVRGISGTVELALLDSETMTADLTYKIVTRRALHRLPVFLARMRAGASGDKQWKDPSIIIDSIRLEDGPELTFVKLNSAGGWAILPEEVPEGTELTLRMSFENKGAIYKLSPSYSRLARSGWLPLVRFGDMIHELDLTVKVPAKYETLGIGEKVSESVANGVSTTQWVPNSPVNFPTIIFGRYHSDTAGFDAETSDGRKIPVRIFVDRAGMTDWGIRPGQLRPLAQQAANSLNLYREIFDVDYPFHKLDLVNDPMGYLYGQSPASLVYLGSASFRGSGVLGSSAKFVRSLVAHEVGHQWWGAMVSHANNRNRWFRESLAEYASALFVEAVNGRKNPQDGRQAYLDHVRDWRTQIMAAKLFGSVQDAPSLSVGGRRAAMYAKGPYAFHIMRNTFGDDRFYAFLGTLTQELAGKEIATRDIQAAAEKALGVDMEWFFDQWIRGVGLPEFTLDYDVMDGGDGTYIVAGSLTQRVLIEGKQLREVEGEFFHGVVPLTLTTKGSKQEMSVRIPVRGKEAPFKFRLDAKPTSVVLNKYGEMLAHDVIEGRVNR